jgi:thiamine pyrophosphate-dependent acetolactate synthase large subunit-like protein
VRRIEAVRQIMAGIKDELVITTTGMISREVYAVRDRPENFYMCGSMGCALPIGLGLGLASGLDIIVMDGDGAALMALNALALARHLRLRNVTHYILDNRVYGSTGGQPTCSAAMDFEAIGHRVRHIPVEPGDEPGLPRIGLTPREIAARFQTAVARRLGMSVPA